MASKRKTNRELVAQKARRNGAGSSVWPGRELIALAKAVAAVVKGEGGATAFAKRCGLPESTVRQAMDTRLCNPRASTLMVMMRMAKYRVLLEPKG